MLRRLLTASCCTLAAIAVLGAALPFAGAARLGNQGSGGDAEMNAIVVTAYRALAHDWCAAGEARALEAARDGELQVVRSLARAQRVGARRALLTEHERLVRAGGCGATGSSAVAR